MDNGLTKKQEAFVREYLKDFNGTASAKRAGYSSKRASEIAYQLLQKSTVQRAITALQNDINQQLRMQFIKDAVTAREVMYQIMVDPNSSDRDKLVAARDFLDRAGFKPTEKREVSGSNGGSIEIMFVEPNHKNSSL